MKVLDNGIIIADANETHEDIIRFAMKNNIIEGFEKDLSNISIKSNAEKLKINGKEINEISIVKEDESDDKKLLEEKIEFSYIFNKTNYIKGTKFKSTKTLEEITEELNNKQYVCLGDKIIKTEFINSIKKDDENE